MIAVVSGASGYIGQAVAETFRRAGFQVYGLVRSSLHHHILQQKEIIPYVSDLEDQASYEKILERCDVFAHCALAYSKDGNLIEEAVLSRLLPVLKNKKTPTCFLYISGCFVYGNTQTAATETSPVSPLSIIQWRPACENLVLEQGTTSFRTVVLRPGFVYGKSGGVTASWFSSLQSGEIDLIERGNNCWAMVHLDDLAHAFLLAYEHSPTQQIFNVADGRSYQIKKVIETMVQKIRPHCRIVSISYDAALKKYGPFAEGLMIDQILSHQKCRDLLHWEPRHKDFLAEAALYFDAWQSYQL